MHKQSRIVPFIFGLALGVLCTIYLPKYVRPYLPESIVGKATIVKGTVVGKEKKGNALLVTVDTTQGSLLATFNKKVDEINMLVNDKDEVEFTLEKYAPFIDDPKITRVVKAQQAPAPEQAQAPAPPAKPAGKSTQEGKLQRKGKPAAAAPDQGEKKTEQ
jgi:hypothetical protein